MKSMKLAFLLALSVALVLVVLQNTVPVQAHFLWFSAEVPAIVLLFLTAAASFVSGLLAAFIMSNGKYPGHDKWRDWQTNTPVRERYVNLAQRPPVPFYR